MSELLRTAEGVATVVIALYVAAVGTLNWYIAREKLRLDLYDRRFNVFSKSLDYALALARWRLIPSEERFEIRTAFVRATREARYLFASDPRIAMLLNEMSDRTAIAVQEHKQKLEMGPLLMNPDLETAALLELEALIEPFLAFRQGQIIPSLRKFSHLQERKRKDSSTSNRR